MPPPMIYFAIISPMQVYDVIGFASAAMRAASGGIVGVANRFARHAHQQLIGQRLPE